MEGCSCCEIGEFGAALGTTPNANYATWRGQRHEGGGVTVDGRQGPNACNLQSNLHGNLHGELYARHMRNTLMNPSSGARKWRL